MSIYARKLALQKFNHDPKIRVLIMSLKAGGVGLNLQRANHMVIMDRWWNPATMDQAIARIHRMTQLKETYIHTVVIKDTIEESLMDNILNKKVLYSFREFFFFFIHFLLFRYRMNCFKRS